MAGTVVRSLSAKVALGSEMGARAVLGGRKKEMVCLVCLVCWATAGPGSGWRWLVQAGCKGRFRRRAEALIRSARVGLVNTAGTNWNQPVWGSGPVA